MLLYTDSLSPGSFRKYSRVILRRVQNIYLVLFLLISIFLLPIGHYLAAGLPYIFILQYILTFISLLTSFAEAFIISFHPFFVPNALPLCCRLQKISCKSFGLQACFLSLRSSLLSCNFLLSIRFDSYFFLVFCLSLHAPGVDGLCKGRGV